jgi:probable phosphomutase (TIGR03848 family)
VPTVILLRHGRTTSNAQGTLAGRQPVGLDDTGQLQAKAAGERLAGVPLAEVVTSPLPRCRETLSLALPDARPQPDERLVECGYGEWEGRPLAKLAKESLWKVVQQYPSAAVFPGGEPLAEMSARAVSAVRDWDARVLAGHGAGAIWLACSHGDVIKAIVADALGLHLDQFQRIVVEPASMTVISYTRLRPFLVRLNDTGTALSTLVPKGRPRRRRSVRNSDAPVGGGAGSSL